MTVHSDLPRPARLLTEVARQYPHAWGQVEHLRSERGRGLPQWPSWCYLPLAGAYAIVGGGGDRTVSHEAAGDIALIGALAAWRATQGIYRIDPDVLDAVLDTPLDRELPSDLLYRLPEWCVYIEVGRDWAGERLHGLFAHLEHDANDGRSELRLLLDLESRLIPIPIHLVEDGTLYDGVTAMMTEAVTRAGSLPSSVAGREQIAKIAQAAAPLVSLVLYLCSQTAEYRDARGSDHQPGRPKPVKTKRGTRLFPPSGPTTWEVSYRLGAAIRAARAAEDREEQEAGARRGPRPHIRRAHWHTYWTGSRDGARERVLRWLPPIAVAVEDLDEIVPTIRPVIGDDR